MTKKELPKDVQWVLKKLHQNGHEAYVVGGCVRDMILGQIPQDWDLTTSAEPDEVKAIFLKTVDTGLQHGTVTVLKNGLGYEVTTYRVDGKYEDNRRPVAVSFTKSLEEDLKRRDFTINAMAYNEERGFVDLYGGIKDLEKGLIRCVGNPSERFNEDALRMLRAIRFAARFNFEIHEDTLSAIGDLSPLIINISAERIRVELTKTLCSPNPTYIKRLVELGIMGHIIPEFMPLIGLIQNNPYHVYTVDEHTYEALNHIDPVEALRWSMLLHDIGKGYSKTTDEKGIDHFYGHQQISVDLSKVILSRLKFDNKTRDIILKLVYYHDERYDNSLKSIRKAMSKMGAELFEDYLAVQRADIKAQAPSKLADRLEDLEIKRSLYEEVLEKQQCLTIKDLNISGLDLIDLGVERGVRIGEILNTLLEVVLEDPATNERAILLDKAQHMM